MHSRCDLMCARRGPQPRIVEHAESEEEVELERWSDLGQADESFLERPYATAAPVTPVLAEGGGSHPAPAPCMNSPPRDGAKDVLKAQKYCFLLV